MGIKPLGSPRNALHCGPPTVKYETLKFISKPNRVHLRWEMHLFLYFSHQLPSTRCSFTIITNVWIGIPIIDLDPRLPISVSIILDVVTAEGLFIHMQIAFVPFRGNQRFKASPEFDSLRRRDDFT